MQQTRQSIDSSQQKKDRLNFLNKRNTCALEQLNFCQCTTELSKGDFVSRPEKNTGHIPSLVSDKTDCTRRILRGKACFSRGTASERDDFVPISSNLRLSKDREDDCIAKAFFSKTLKSFFTQPVVAFEFYVLQTKQRACCSFINQATK